MKKTVASLLMLMMILFCFSGCSEVNQRPAPQIELDGENVIRWERVDDTGGNYSVYVNGECVHGNVGSVGNYYELDISAEDVYTVYVVANGTWFSHDSEKSNEIVIEIKDN